jgi:hypothetical protein
MKSLFTLTLSSTVRVLALMLFCFASCSKKPTKHFTDVDVANAWADMSLFVTKNTPANSPTYASRCFGYIGVTMYESIVHSDPEYKSLAGQLNGLEALPTPKADSEYSWPIALSAGQAEILKKIYNQTSDANKAKIDSLEKLILDHFANDTTDDEVISRSINYGKAVAGAIFEWSKTDGGHRGYLKNFDKSLIPPTLPGSWEPPLYAQSFSHFPLHPHWGDNRTFVKKNKELIIPGIIAFEKAKESSYYNQFLKVYEKSKSLTQAEKEAALWWGDDPGETFTPPGHSYYLALCVLKKDRPALIKCAETYARVGIAVADAFINCWKWKYHFFSERPSSFISKNVDEKWESFWPDPPFPAFPSGHATQAGAVAAVLSDLYGDEITLTDSAHVGRARDELRDVDFKPRSFSSFSQLAEEIANSRFYGGIHTQQDNDIGLAEGRKMGENVNGLIWQKNETYAPDKP